MTCQHSAFTFFHFCSRLISLPNRNIFQFMCRIRRKPFWWSEIKSISYTFASLVNIRRFHDAWLCRNFRLMISARLETNWKNLTWQRKASVSLETVTWKYKHHIVSWYSKTLAKEDDTKMIRNFSGIISMMCICMKIKWMMRRRLFFSIFLSLRR